MDLDKSLKLVTEVLAQLKLSKAEHAQLDQAMATIIRATQPLTLPLPEGL